jgi:Family of unknown function (DUF6525)
MSNLRSSLARRQKRRDPMAVYDACPPPLRAWLQRAALPWTPWSALRVWHKAMRRGGDPARALARLEQAEAARLARDRMVT